MRLLPRPLQAGFTLIEIMVIAPIVILAIGAFVTVIISMTGEVLASRGSNALAYNVQDAISRIDQDVKLSTSFLAKNSIDLSNNGAQGYNNDAPAYNQPDSTTTNFTNAGGVSGTTLILTMLVTNGNPLDSTTGVVYLKDKPNACGSGQVQDNTPMTMNVVYFVKNNTLWRRTIMPNNYTSGSIACSTPWQRPSCTPQYTAPFCKTNDIKLVEGGVAMDFFVQYFSSANATTPNTVASDGAGSVDIRNTALSGVPTVGVSISASQSVAGRTIDRSATLRATRLETNASTIALNADTTPSTPIVTGTVTGGENAAFSWQPVSGGNVTYDVDYNIDGGGWTNALNDTTNLTYSRIAVRDQTVNVRVIATNSAGSSSYGTASVKIPLWNSVPFTTAGWSNYNTPYATFGYTKTSAGLVVLKGLIKKSSAPVSGEVIATLPVGFRPPAQLMIQLINSGTSGRVYVEPDGDISVIALDAAWVSLQDISFIASTAGYTATALPLVNSWVNYGGGVHADATSITDSAGRTNVMGLIKNGSTGSETNMVQFAAGTLPPKRVYLPTAYAGTWGLIVGDPSGFIKSGITSATYTAINLKFYPTSRVDGTNCTTTWCDLTMAASWVPYGNTATAYPQPQYTKGSDGLVMLRGLVKNGTVTAGTTMTTLPAGYRPKERMIFQVNAGAGIGRLDVLPTGIVEIQQASATYTSMDSIYFMAEQ